MQTANEQLVYVNRELNDLNEKHKQAKLYAEAICTTIHEPLLVLTHDYRIKSANESFYKKFHITQKEAIGNILFDLEKSQWNIPFLRHQLSKIRRGKESFLEWEITYTFPRSGKRTICFKAKPFQKIHGEGQILLAFDDITIRKEKENTDKKNSDELVKLLENIQQITSTANANGSVTYFNKFFLNFSGMTFKEAIKKGLEPVINPQMLNEYQKSWSEALKTGENFKMELQLMNKNDGIYRWHLCRALPILNDEGVIISWIGTATDIHEQKMREEVKDEFMSIASHELKTPLTTAKAYVQLLERGLEKNNDGGLMYARKAGVSINRLGDLISDLLDVNKIKNGKLSHHLTTFDFSEMMSAAIDDVQCVSHTHKIIVNKEIHQNIRGDKERLQQVIVNLLGNAVKYSPAANKVFVNVVTKNGEIKVSVKDRGIGIRKENLTKIFERYYREEGRAVHFQGLGIGLYISYEIIQRHNGKLWAEINGGSGSTFHFTLPI